MARAASDATPATTDTNANKETFTFVPLALRHDFQRANANVNANANANGDDDANTNDNNDANHEAVAAARRTRSAWLVSSLLYAGDNQHSHNGDGAVSTKIRKKPRKPPPASTKPTPTLTPTPTPPLYSLAVELAISKRMAFDGAVEQLDMYFTGLRATVDRLSRADAHDRWSAPAWLWAPATRLPTMLQLQRQVVQSVAACLPDCDVYLAMHEPLPLADPMAATPWPRLTYVAASAHSSMAGRVLVQEPSPDDAACAASFAVVGSLDPLLVEDIGHAAAWRVQLLDDGEQGTRTRTGPFACLPLVDASDTTGVGVLALDACRRAAQLLPEAMSPLALYEFLVRMQLPDAAVEFRKLRFGGRQLLQLTASDLQHRPAYRHLKIQTKQRVVEVAAALRSGAPLHLPAGKPPLFFCSDDDALALLDDVCERAGKALDEYGRRVHWHREMAMRTKNVQTTSLDVYAILIQGIANALVRVKSVHVWKIRDCSEIDAIATTHLPEDRLLPFLQWNERQIRRVSLYMENSEDQGRLMQGNVTRIHLPVQGSDSAHPSYLCERALYHVTWSNRTQQSFSWPKLRLILPIRPMNARHYQLSQLLKKLQARKTEPTTSGDALNSHIHFRLTDPSASVVVLHDSHRPDDVDYVLEIDLHPRPVDAQQHDAVDAEQVDRFVQRAVAITQQNVSCVRGREVRSLKRQLSTAATSSNFSSIGLTPSGDALRTLDDIVAITFNEISANLPGTQQQLAELQPDGGQLRFTFAANGSTLLGKTLPRGMGVSFRCVDSLATLVVGHDSELRSRLKWIGERPAEADADADFPIVFLPLIHDDACLGVLSVNRFVDVPKGRVDEVHPEEGVVEYLMALAKQLATAIYLKRRSFALHTLSQLRLEPLCSPEQLFFCACTVLRDVIVGVGKLRVIEIDFVRGQSTPVYEYSEAARAHAETLVARQVFSLGFRATELLPDTVRSHWNLSAEDVDKLYQLCGSHEEQVDAEEEQLLSSSTVNEMERRKYWEWKVRQRYFRLNFTPREDDASTSKPDSKPAERAVAVRVSNQKYLTQVLSSSLSSKTIAFSAVPALALSSSSAAYVAIAILPQFFASCEQNFVDRVADSLSRMLEALRQRVERSRRRVEALERLKTECGSFVQQTEISLSRKPLKTNCFPLSTSEELRVEECTDLLDLAVRFISSCLDGPSVYIALHEPFHRRLHYVAATSASSMKGKMLHRGHGLSFHALDSGNPVVITPTTREEVERASDRGAKLRVFSADPSEALEGPFIAVPVGSIGILALDTLEQYARTSGEAQPEFGLVDFLQRAAAFVGDAVQSVREKSRLLRRRRREEAVVRVMAACEDLGKSVGPLYVQHIVLHAVESALNGVDAYIGIVQPLCSSIVFLSATTDSEMLNQRVDAVDSVSFKVFLSQRPLVIPELERKQFDSSELQTAQLLHQLRWFTPSQAHGRKGPFVCIPIPFVGVLSVDTFPGADGGIYSSSIPEYGVMQCLTTMANLLGESIRQLTAAETMREISKLFEGNRSTFRVVFYKLLSCISRNVLTAIELSVLCYDEELSWSCVHGADAPLATLKSQVDAYSGGLSASIADLEPEIRDSLRRNDSKQSRCFSLPSHAEVVVVQCLDIRDVDSTGNGHVDWSSSCRLLKTAIVIRRVRGANWTYDQEFLQSILPLVDELVERVNLRVCGVVARRSAEQQLIEMSGELERTASSSMAFEGLAHFVNDALNIVAQAASQIPGDAYLGERCVGGNSLQFIASTDSSLMRGVQLDLASPENQALTSVTSLRDQHRAVVHLLEAKNEQLLRPLTSKRAQRVYVAIPMSEDRVLCLDSLSTDAFDATHMRLERDVGYFLEESASQLESTILSVRYRHSYDQLCRLKTQRHQNFREYFALLHEILRRDVNVLHSQQILELANDFTGHFKVRSWHRCSTRRPIRGSVSPHFCFVNGCERKQVGQEIHYEQHVQLPMTNLPRTLDQSRAALEPSVGREKQGAYACDCMAAMLDCELMAAPKLALCVYSHDETKPPSKLPRAFSLRQRQFFFAFSAVASDVYRNVFRACVLETFDVELLFIARDRLNAKDAVLLRVQPGSNEESGTVSAVTGCLMPPTKWLPGTQITGKLADRASAFHHECRGSTSTRCSVTMTKAAAVRSGAKTALVSPSRTEGGSNVATTQSTDPPAKKPFFKRPRIFGTKATQTSASSVSSPVAPTIIALAPLPTAEFHVLIRGRHEDEVLSLTVERQIPDGYDPKEQLSAEVCQLIDESRGCAADFAASPRGDEEWNGAGFGEAATIGEGGEFGGGGFHVLSCWSKGRDELREQLVHFDTDIRSYLTGVQATSRDQISHLVASNIRPGLLPPQSASAPHFSVFARNDPRLRTAAVVLVRAALVLCGYKKEVAMDAPPEKDEELLTEYLRAGAGRKILELDPRNAAKWPIVLRAGNYIKTMLLNACRFASALDSHSGIHAPTRACRSLLIFVQAIASAVKYFKFLQDNAKQRMQTVDSVATRIQCAFRGMLAKTMLQRLRLECRAAIAIQCAFRQHLARRQRAFLKWNRAAVTVQRAYRRKLAQRRGRRPRKLTLELRTVAAKYGSVQVSGVGSATGENETEAAWNMEMESFDSFKAYLESRMGREQLKREGHIIADRLKEVARHREQHMDPHERLLADIHDIFELLDVDGREELSRERTQELMTRLHIPLSGDEVDDVINMMDDDRSGAISFAEFTNWFSHEFTLLKKRSRECGVLSKRDRQWVVDESARSAMRKLWRARRKGTMAPSNDGEVAVGPTTESKLHEEP